MLYRKDSRIFGSKALVFYVVSNHPLPGLYTGLVPLPSHMQVRHSHTLHISLSSSGSDTSLDWKLSFTIIIDCSEADKLILVLKQSAYCIDLYLVATRWQEPLKPPINFMFHRHLPQEMDYNIRPMPVKKVALQERQLSSM